MNVLTVDREVLPRERSSPRRVRALVARVLDDAGLGDERVRLAQLLASELATNAVRHGRGATFAVEVEAHDGIATVRVHDDDPAPPTPRVPDQDELQQGGWGLDLVERLSRAWGVEPDTGGKVVWFTLGTEDR